MASPRHRRVRLPPFLRLLDGVQVDEGLRNSSQDNLTHWLISTQAGHRPQRVAENKRGSAALRRRRVGLRAPFGAGGAVQGTRLSFFPSPGGEGVFVAL